MNYARQIPDYVTGEEERLQHARMLGHRDDGLLEGRKKGLEEGHAQGRQTGYQEGHSDGRVQGWDEAVAQANVKISEQLEYTRQHVADKAAMQKQLQAQAVLIDQFTKRLNELERENGTLKKSNGALRDVATALKGANERLQTEVSNLDEKLTKRTKEYVDQLWKYNRNMVFMNSVQLTLEELTQGGGPQAERIHEVFAKKYEHQVSKNMANGGIRTPPHKDAAFAAMVPTSQKFILDMLAAVAAKTVEPRIEVAATRPADEHSFDY